MTSNQLEFLVKRKVSKHTIKDEKLYQGGMKFNSSLIKPPADVTDFEMSQSSKLDSKSGRNYAEAYLILKGLNVDVETSMV